MREQHTIQHNFTIIQLNKIHNNNNNNNNDNNNNFEVLLQGTLQFEYLSTSAFDISFSNGGSKSSQHAAVQACRSAILGLQVYLDINIFELSL